MPDNHCPPAPLGPAGVARPVGWWAQRLPLPRRTGIADCASIRYWNRPGPTAGRPDGAPVLFVHGYAGTEHSWGPLRAALADAGFGCLIALRYNAFRADIHQVADWLVDRATHAARMAGVGGVHLIGHSMGGLVIRDAVQNRGLGALAATAVTIATPHSGCRLARFVPGPAARQMRPGSDFLAGLGALPERRRTRWVLIHGAADRVVRLSGNEFGGPDADFADLVTVREPAAGHGSITRNPGVIARVVAELQRAEPAQPIQRGPELQRAEPAQPIQRGPGLPGSAVTAAPALSAA